LVTPYAATKGKAYANKILHEYYTPFCSFKRGFTKVFRSGDRLVKDAHGVTVVEPGKYLPNTNANILFLVSNDQLARSLRVPSARIAILDAVADSKWKGPAKTLEALQIVAEKFEAKKLPEAKRLEKLRRSEASAYHCSFKVPYALCHEDAGGIGIVDTCANEKTVVDFALARTSADLVSTATKATLGTNTPFSMATVAEIGALAKPTYYNKVGGCKSTDPRYD